MAKDNETTGYSEYATTNLNSNDNCEHDLIFARLTELFGEIIPQNVLYEICVENNWQEETCIEEMIKYVEQAKDCVVLTEEIFQGQEHEGNYKIVNKQAATDEDVDFDDEADIVIESFEEIASEQYNNNGKAVKMYDHNQSYQPKMLGAIPKNMPSTPSNIKENSISISSSISHQHNNNISNSSTAVDFAKILSKGIKEFTYTSPSASTDNTASSRFVSKNNNQMSKDYESIVENINKGYKLLVLMRGAPGTGKSTLARKLIAETLRADFQNHIFSADDFFYDMRGNFAFRPDQLPEAHDFNLRRVRQRAAAGWSPIVVDNTNVKTWEMGPYAQVAAQYGYIVKILVPQNSGSNSAVKCASRNVHGVPKIKIARMMEMFEPTTVEELFKINHLIYSIAIPQFRDHPPLEFFEHNKKAVTPAEMKSSETTSNYLKTETSLSWTPYDIREEEPSPKTIQLKDLSIPKPPRNVGKAAQFKNTEADLSGALLNQPELDIDWKSYEVESNEFWYQKSNRSHNGTELEATPKPQRAFVSTGVNNKVEENIVSILKEDFHTPKLSTESESADRSGDRRSSITHRHKIDCPNESKSFIMLRQIYPNKKVDELWDLFEKCNGDMEWTIDILLKDDVCHDQEFRDTVSTVNGYLNCDCNKIDSVSGNNVQLSLESQNLVQNSLVPAELLTPIAVKSQRCRSKKDKALHSDELLEAKKAIEKQFTIGNEHYSTHVKKIRDLRYGTPSASDTDDATMLLSASALPNNNVNYSLDQKESSVEPDPSASSDEKPTDDDISSENDNDEMVEIKLGTELLEQLEMLFGVESSSKEEIKQYKTNVFMPKGLAKQIYAIWMESLNNQLEEQKQKSLREDEEFARLIAYHEKYSKLYEAPKNFKEIMDMELAWNTYQSDVQNWKDNTPQDIASQLSRMKLYESFPNVDEDILLEILNAHDNKFSDTVDVLNNTLKSDIENVMQIKGKELMDRAKHEVEQKTEDNTATEIDSNVLNNDYNYNTKNDDVENDPKILKSNPEQAKRLAIKDFEETRNLAAHHSQLKAECFRKATEAIQQGRTGVAVYYSQIANLHSTKIEKYNQKAANCIMEVHDLNQNNPDFIDLHYLHVQEASECLDIFIDKHINKLRNSSRTYKYIYVITGRGLHSSGGFSAIKNKVKSRLRERNLKWAEVNPGLLKAKIFTQSRYSADM